MKNRAFELALCPFIVQASLNCSNNFWKNHRDSWQSPHWIFNGDNTFEIQIGDNIDKNLKNVNHPFKSSKHCLLISKARKPTTQSPVHSGILLPFGFSWEELAVCYIRNTTPWSLSHARSVVVHIRGHRDTLECLHVSKIPCHAAAAISTAWCLPFCI